MKKYTSTLHFVLALLFTAAAFGQTVPPPTNGLYGHWRFDETSGTTAADASGNGRTGTLGSSSSSLPTWLASGWANGCIAMPTDVVARHVSVPSVTWTPVDFTVSFWMNPYQLTGGQWGQVITASGNFWGKFTFILSPIVDGSTRAGMVMVGTDAATVLVLPAGTVEANKWQHYTFTFDGDAGTGVGEGKFYENGRLLASRTGMALSQAWNGFSIGIGDPRARLQTQIDEMRLYSRALSAAEVAALADDGLYAHWRFDETSGTTAADASGNGRTGTLYNSPTWLASGWANGCIAMPTDVVARHVHAPGVTWTPVDFTVSFWMNPYQLAGGQWGQVITASGNFWGKFTFVLLSDGSIQVGTDGATILVIPAGTVETNKWQLYTFTFDGNTSTGVGEGKFYENGQLLASRTDMALSQAWNGFSIGIGDPRARLQSRIDEMRLYSRALSAAEVAALASGPLTATWRTDAPGTDWNAAVNWVEGAVPLTTTDVTVNTCTNCPNLAVNRAVKSILINGGQLRLNTSTLSATAGVRLQGAKLISSEGALQAADFWEVKDCTVEGNLLLRKTGNVNNVWSGNNTFRGKITIVNQGTGTIAPATQADDTVSR